MGGSSSHTDPVAIDSAVDIYLERNFLGPMMIEDVASPKELDHAVHQICIFSYYRGVNGYIRMADYQSFNEFKNGIYGADIIAVSMGETVNFP